MSDQHTLSRRKAITLLGMSAAGLGVAATQLNSSTVCGSADELQDIAAPTRSQYIFGYGSLIQRESRMRASASASSAFPVIVKGVSRGWFDQPGGPSWNPTYLGAVLDKSGTCNGVIFPVTSEEFAAYDKREVGYQLTKIDPSQITMLDGSHTARRRHLVLRQHGEEISVI
jgi:cation transport regulator ChaC